MSLNVIGLISGGKDSLFSLAHCIKNGHTVIALANLLPADAKSSPAGEESEDVNSFMYQTVGYSAITLYAEALELPLYRRAISGAALQKEKDYEISKVDSEQIDETEDMYLLLKDVLEKHPDANALCAGAILSTYQRTRVESVAVRLGLVPLAYLWQYPALPPPISRQDSLTGLLDDMRSAGCDARIIKLASAGIRSNMLFSNVTSSTCTSQLLAGLSRFYVEPELEFELRGAILGEGGEYETLALDGPGLLWKKKIATDLTETSETDGVMYARFTSPRIVEKDHSFCIEMPVPTVFDKRFDAVLERCYQMPTDLEKVQDFSGLKTAFPLLQMSQKVVKIGNFLQICNLTAPGHDAAEQFTNVLDELFRLLPLHQAKDSSLNSDNMLSCIISTNLLLADINDFAEVNRVYSNRLWPSNRAIPPARVTVAAFLRPGTLIALSLVLDTSIKTGRQGSRGRDGLHVQSRSYWAPANIGPYSQAVSAPLALVDLPENTPFSKMKVVHMAGQIPLQPSSMQLFETPFAEQAALALQHLWRVGQERSVDLWLGAGVAYFSDLAKSGSNYTSDGNSASTYIQEAAAIWELAHLIDEKGNLQPMLNQNDMTNEENSEEEEDIDVWHLHQNRVLASRIITGNHLHNLPNYSVLSTTKGSELYENNTGPCVPVFIAAEVSELPRSASVEWWSKGLAGLAQSNIPEGSSVSTFQKTISKGCVVTGTILRNSTIDKSDVSVDVDEFEDHIDFSRRSENLTCFGTMLVHLDADLESLITLINNIGETLLQALQLNTVLPSHQISATQSFLGLSTSLDLQNLITRSELIQGSVIVPCKRVWASDYSQRSFEPPTLPVINELAVATIFRLDIW